MTFVQSPVALGPRHSDDVLADSPDDKISGQSGQESTASPADDAQDMTAAGTLPLRTLGFAGLSGAAAAAVVALVVTAFPLRTYDDPRMQQIIHDNGELTTRVQALTDKVRVLETEGVATSQTSDALSGRVQATSGEVDSIKATLSALVVEQDRGRDTMAGVSAPALFGVAVVQLRNQLEAGRPFDWELVNLRGIVGSDPALLTELERLVPMATGGVTTQERLLSAMQVLIAREGSGNSLVQAGLGVVSRVLGPNMVEAPGHSQQVLTRATARLSAGDLTNFVREMQGLGASAAQGARPVVEAARQRMVALQAVQTLLRAARSGLQTQLRSVATIAAPVRPAP